jgi:spermidine synthase
MRRKQVARSEAQPITPGRHQPLIWSAMALFFLSGAAALLYQVAWQRMLALFSGVDLFSATITVAAFMAGMGFGALAGGNIADRLSRRGAIAAFAAAETGIALFALASRWLYYDLLYQRFGYLAESLPLMGIIIFSSLLIPTFLMGMSLPLLARGLTWRLNAASGIIGGLYGINTLGAACGSLVSAWWIIRAWGLPGALYAGMLLNGVCAAGAIILAAAGHFENGGITAGLEAAEKKEKGRTPARRFPFSVWLLIYLLSGFIALSLEMVWFRLLGIMSKSNAFTFPTLLTWYLGGLALGTLAGIPLSRRTALAGRWFFICQGTTALYAALSISLLVHALGQAPNHFLDEIYWYFGRYDPLDMKSALFFFSGNVNNLNPKETRLFLLLYGALPAFLILPPTLLMGLSFPLLHRVAQTDMGRVGRRTGRLQTANIAGAAFGAIGGSWLLLHYLGTVCTLRVLVLLSGIFWLLYIRSRLKKNRNRRIAEAFLALALAGVCALIPANAKLWGALHGADQKHIVYEEDGTGLFVLRHRGDSRFCTVYSGGRGQSRIPFGSAHTLLGMLPAMIHPAPEDIAIIGLGSGDTLFSAGGRIETENLICVEIVGAQWPALQRYAGAAEYGGLLSLEKDPRVCILTNDGRRYLALTEQRFDIIEADALFPDSAGSNNLYSREYFELMKSRLKPGGIAVTWAPTPRIAGTFLKVFPHVLRVDEFLFGSETAVPFDVETLRRRLSREAVKSYYARAGLDTDALWREVTALETAYYGPEYDRSGITDINTDLYPHDEYIAPLYATALTAY